MFYIFFMFSASLSLYLSCNSLCSVSGSTIRFGLQRPSDSGRRGSHFLMQCQQNCTDCKNEGLQVAGGGKAPCKRKDKRLFLFILFHMMAQLVPISQNAPLHSLSQIKYHDQAISVIMSIYMANISHSGMQLETETSKHQLA